MGSISSLGRAADTAFGGVPVAKVETTATSMTGRGEIRGAEFDRPATPVVEQTSVRTAAPASAPATPAPVYTFASGTTSATRVDVGGTPADSNVAASRTHVCITTRAAFACYTKGGALVKPGAGLSARAYPAQEFFTASGLPIGAGYDGSTSNVAKDGRIVYDRYRSRFFMVFQTRESPARLMLATSKTEDPRDGWWTFADTVGTASKPVQDYDKIGVNASWFLVSTNIGTPGNTGTTMHFLYSAADLASGTPYVRGQWSHVDAVLAAPCVHDSTATDSTGSFWVNRDDATHVSVWAVRSGSVYRRKVTVQSASDPLFGAVAKNSSTVDYANIGRTPQNAVFRNGKIVLVSNVGHVWSGQTSASSAVQLTRLNVSQYFASTPTVSVELDRIFGRSSVGDPSGSVFDYGWPAVSVNGAGDIVVGEIRSNSTIYPEFRASVWFAGQADISSSILLQGSSGPLTEFHMAGASADPSTAGVYVSQQFGASCCNFRIRVAKMLGSVMPDVIATAVTAPGTIAHGASGTATVTITNQGDATMPASQADLRLSTNNVISTNDVLLKTFSVPSLAPKQFVSLSVPFTVSSSQAAGKYFVGVRLDTGGVATEYSEDNNDNPFLAGNHGNVVMKVT